ncbi:hypothetical protein DBB42_06555 [Pseudomonas plecoglossicida]|uniref:Uncharacterized protein n=1 Tax=Pseudomonas plecoglossicida TaxID=70775 RepID=A0A2R7UQZ1_PSEDL|nr:hypothetical protein DBB42_06555 [Pseudomonas plecoglossicida]
MNARNPESIPGRCRLLNPGAALQPNRDARPLPQEIAVPCGSGLASRMGRMAAPLFLGDYCA